MELYREEYGKGFHRGSLLNVFCDKLAFNSRTLDTMFPKQAIKAASLVLQTEFLENDNYIASILGKRGEKKERKTQSAHLSPLWPGLHRYYYFSYL